MKVYSIGRDVGCDIVINDPTDVISRRHATLSVADNGKMTITDLSRNGTYVNGIRISQNVAVPVTRKDNISFAHVAKFDWNLIPNTTSTILRYAIFGVIAVAVIVALCFILPPLFNGQTPETDKNTATVDSAQLKKDQEDKAAALKADIKKQVEDSLAREKAKRDSIANAKKKKSTPNKKKGDEDDTKKKDEDKNKDNKQTPEEPTFH